MNECDPDGISDIYKYLVHNCHNDSNCTNAKGSFHCTCLIGYTGDGVRCEDIDECYAETDNCHADANCSNTKGSFYCTCHTGYSGDGVICEDINECSPHDLAANNSHYAHNCHADANCSNTKGSFYCTCHVGYSGDGVMCLDIDECETSTDNCDVNAHCNNTKGSFRCTCKVGYFGDGVVCKDIDECTEDIHNCHDDGICINTNGSFYCLCQEGYTGDGVNCTDVEECSLSIHTCDEHATCTNTKGSFTCACDRGYHGTGYKCVDTDECNYDLDDCHADALCINTNGSFNCTCLKGYSGDGVFCEDIDECETATHNCSWGASCNNRNGSFYCTCSPGFSGDGFRCADINECEVLTHNCHPDAECTNLNGSFYCTCNRGFRGNGTDCEDLDECSGKSHNCKGSSSCNNTHSGFNCICLAGYRYNGSDCWDIDECSEQTHNCHEVYGVCTNQAPFFLCTCALGSKGNGTYCVALDLVYKIDLKLPANNWIEEYRFSNTTQFQKLSQEIEQGVDYVYTSDESFLRMYVAALHNSDGIVQAELWMVFTSDATLPIRPLNLAVKRERLKHLSIEMDGYVVTQVVERVDCPLICSEFAYCARNGSSFECVCTRGYNGDGHGCIDQDECTVNNGGCQHMCINSPHGSYQCLCNQGFFLHSDRRQCRASEGESAYCASEWSQDVLWSHTVESSTDVKSCPQDHFGGDAQRICYSGISSGVWGVPDLTRCLTKAMYELQQKFSKLLKGEPSFSDLLGIGWELRHILDPKVDKIYAGDIFAAVDIMNDLNERITYLMKNITKDELTNFLEIMGDVVSNLLNVENRQAWNGMDKIALKATDMVAALEESVTAVAYQQVQDMLNNAITDPEKFHNLSLRTKSPNVEISIDVVEMIEFRGILHSLMYDLSAVGGNGSIIRNQIYYPPSLFENALKDKLASGFYSSLGCFTDNDKDRAVPTMEGTHELLKGSFLTRTDAVEKCAEVTRSRGWRVFAVQDGGWCASSPNAQRTYNKYGTALNCVNGKGGMLANDVYIINAYYTSVSSVFYKNLEGLLTSDPLLEIRSLKEMGAKKPYNRSELNSIIISGRIISEDHFYQSLPEPIALVFEHLDQNHTSSGLCCYFNMESTGPDDRWFDDGCYLYHTNATHTICHCSHLTNFALLLDLYDSPDVIEKDEDLILSLMSYVGCVLSSACCFFSVLLYSILHLKGDRIHVHKNLAFNMGVVQLLFFFGTGQTQNKWLCKAVGIALHFFLAAMFAWMLVEGWHLYLAIIKVLSTQKKSFLKRYYILGYGLPTGVTALSMAIFWDNYGVGKICWMTEIVLVSLFLPPVVVVILTNIVILGMVIGVLISPTTEKRQKYTSDKNFINNIRVALKASLLLLPLLGITWLLGFLQVNSDTAVMSYAFVLLSSFQGVYFFVTNVVMDQEVCTTFKKRFLKKHYSWSFFRTSSTPSVQDGVRQGDILAASVKRATAYSNESFSSRKTFEKRQMEGRRNENRLYSPNSDIKRQWQEMNEY